jgi:hypothetical protein
MNDETKIMPYDYPLRERSVMGYPKDSVEGQRFLRSCRKCGASFNQLAPGKVGLRGVWHDWSWYCSHECAGQDFAQTDPEPFTFGEPRE